MFKGLIRSNDDKRERIVTVVNNGNCLMETPPKLPKPHTRYDFTPSSVAKKFRRLMADDAI